MTLNIKKKTITSLFVTLFFVLFFALLISGIFVHIEKPAKAIDISNATQLEDALRNKRSASYIHNLTANVTWTCPPDTSTTNFTATLNGNGYTITLNAKNYSSIQSNGRPRDASNKEIITASSAGKNGDIDGNGGDIGLLVSRLIGTIKNCNIILTDHAYYYDYTGSSNNYTKSIGIVCGSLRSGQIENVHIIVNGSLNFYGEDRGSGISEGGGHGVLIGGFAGRSQNIGVGGLHGDGGPSIVNSSITINGAIHAKGEDYDGNNDQGSSSRVCAGGFIGEVRDIVYIHGCDLSGGANGVIGATTLESNSSHKSNRAGGLAGVIRDNGAIHLEDFSYNYLGVIVVRRSSSNVGILIGRNYNMMAAWRIMRQQSVERGYSTTHAITNNVRQVKNKSDLTLGGEIYGAGILNIIDGSGLGSANGTGSFCEYSSVYEPKIAAFDIANLQYGSFKIHALWGVYRVFVTPAANYAFCGIDYLRYDIGGVTHVDITNIYGSNLTTAVAPGEMAWYDISNLASYVVPCVAQIQMSTISKSANKTYDGGQITFSVSGEGVRNPAFYLRVTGQATKTSSLNANSINAGKDAGTYSCHVSNSSGTKLAKNSIMYCSPGTYNPHYMYVYDGTTVSTTISKRNITVTPVETNKIYGDADPTFTYTITSGTLVSGDTPSGSLSRVVGALVGQYNILVGSFTFGNNYNMSFTTGKKFGISKKTISVESNTSSKMYGNDDPLFAPKLVNGSQLVSGDAFSGALGRAQGENVGTYLFNQGTLTVKQGTLSVNDCYNIIVSQMFTIESRPLTITFDNKSKQYGELDPTFTYTINNGTLANNEELVGNISRELGTTVRSYDISRGSLTIVNTASNTNVMSNYNYQFYNGQLTITPRNITITAKNKSKVYGDTDPVLDYTLTGSMAYVDEELTGGLTRNSGTAVNSYDILQGSLKLNKNANCYAITYVKGTLTITPRPITVKARPASKIYGNPDPQNLLYDITSGSLVTNDGFSGAFVRDGGENVTANGYAITKGSFTAGSNYNLTFIGNTFTINKRPITIRPNNKTITYGDDVGSITVDYGDKLYSDNISVDTSVAYSKYGNAGSYSIAPIQKTFDNYEPNWVNGTLTVSKKAVTISVANINITYGQALPSFNISKSGLVNNDAISTSATAEGYQGNAGDYTIRITRQEYTNYAPSYVDGLLRVGKANATITGTSIQTHTYDGAVKNIVATHPSGLDLTYSPQKGYTNVGEYDITVSLPESQNYYSAPPIVLTLKINRKTVTVTAENKSMQYGDIDPQLTYQHTGIATVDNFVGYLVRESGDLPGEYEIGQGYLSINTINNYELIFVVGKLTITKRSLTIKAENKSKVYGDSDPSLTYDIISGSIVFGDNLTGVLVRDSGEDVADYVIRQGSIANNNYNITYQTGTFYIMPRAIMIRAEGSGKVYGQVDPPLAYNVVNGELVGGDILQGSLTRQTGENVAIYSIMQGTITSANNPNYTVSFSSNNFVISKKAIRIEADDKQITYGDVEPQFTVNHIGLVAGDTFSETCYTNYNRYDAVGIYYIYIQERTYDNYTAEFVNATLNVVKKSIIIKANDAQIVYGDYIPSSYTATYTGVVGGDILYDYVYCQYSRFDDAGTYDIIVDPTTYTNYTATYEKGTLTVSKANVIIRAENKTIVYGDNIPPFTIAYQGLMNGDTLTDIATTIYKRYDDAGIYDIVVTTKQYTNYQPTYNVGKLTVSKAQITITADSKSIVYGEIPTYTISYEGLLNNDVLVDTVSCSYQQYSNAGNYTIRVNNKTHTNYEVIEYIDGRLTVNKRATTITADDIMITYGQQPTFTITYGNRVNNDDLGDTISCSYVRYGNVGEYAININEKSYTNYTATYFGGTLTVNKKAVNITADNKSITYGDSVPTFTFTFDGLVNNDQLTPMASTSYIKYGNVGVFDIVIDSQVFTNYAPIFHNGVLTVNKAPLTITARNESIYYKEVAPQFRFDFMGIINNDAIEATATTNYQVGNNVGEYDIFVMEESFTNYLPTYINGILYVLKANAVIQADEWQLHYFNTETKSVEAYLNHTETVLQYSPSNSFIDVGLYHITISSVETTNYNSASKEIYLEIQKPRVFVTVDAKQKIYGEADPMLTFSYDFRDYQAVGDSVFGALERLAGENVGQYAIQQGTVSAGNDYQIVYFGKNLEINPRPLTLTAVPVSKVYGEDDPDFEYNITSGNLIGSDTLLGNLSRITGRNFGNYMLILGDMIELNPNYNLTLLEEYLYITRRPITLTADDMSKIYGDSDPALTYTITSGSLAYDDSILDTVSRELGEDVGEYRIIINQSSNNNYDVTYDESNMFIIYQREITITAHNKMKQFGEPDETLTYDVTTNTLAFNDQLSGVFVREIGVDVGVYEIYQGGVTTANNPNYIINFVGAYYTIIKRTITIEVDAKQKTYGEADPTLTYRVTVSSVIESCPLIGTIRRIMGENVGDYEIHSGSLLNETNPNYDITFIPNYFTINRRPITVTASPTTKQYGNLDPPLMYYVESGVLVNEDTLRGVLARELGEDVGEYAILQGGRGGITNENNPNYNIIFVSKIFEITRRGITISADRTTRQYGDIDPIITYRITLGSLVSGDNLNGALTRELGEELGEYSILQGTITTEQNTNYTIAFINNVFEIIKRSITITPSELSKIYGENDPQLTYDIIVGSVAFEEVLVGEIYRDTGEIVGNYTMQSDNLNNANNGNYNITFIERDFVINRRPITLTAYEKDKTYGYDDPEFNYDMTSGNLVFDDELIGILAREWGENAGYYQITHGSLSNTNNPNYDIILTEIYFLINRRAISIRAENRTKIYGYQDPLFHYEITSAHGLVDGDNLVGELGRVSGENVGIYSITIGTLGNDNYEISIDSGWLEILPRELTIRADAMTFLHGSMDNIELTYSITGEVLEQDESFISSAINITTSARPNSRVGEYLIHISLRSVLHNYRTDLIGATLTILPGIITGIEFADMKVLYDEEEHTLLAVGNIDEVDITYTNNSGTEIGVYHAKAVVFKENYNELTLNATLVIMTSEITTAEPLPEAIIVLDEGIYPYIIPIIMPIHQNETAVLVNNALDNELYEKEIINKMFRISLYENGQEIPLNNTAQVKILVPSSVREIDSLRLLHIVGNQVYEVPYVMLNGYVVFLAEELGDYAFVSEATGTQWGDRIAEVLFYVGISFMGLVVLLFIVGTLMKSKKKRRYKY